MQSVDFSLSLKRKQKMKTRIEILRGLKSLNHSELETLYAFHLIHKKRKATRGKPKIKEIKFRDVVWVGEENSFEIPKSDGEETDLDTTLPYESKNILISLSPIKKEKEESL